MSRTANAKLSARDDAHKTASKHFINIHVMIFVPETYSELTSATTIK